MKLIMRIWLAIFPPKKVEKVESTPQEKVDIALNFLFDACNYLEPTLERKKMIECLDAFHNQNERNKKNINNNITKG